MTDEEFPSETSMMHPMELQIDRDQLIADTELLIAELREFREKDPNNLAHRRFAKWSIQQAIDWLSWLRRQPEGRIRVMLYPAKEAEELIAELPELGDERDDDLPLF